MRREAFVNVEELVDRLREFARCCVDNKLRTPLPPMTPRPSGTDRLTEPAVESFDRRAKAQQVQVVDDVQRALSLKQVLVQV